MVVSKNLYIIFAIGLFFMCRSNAQEWVYNNAEWIFWFGENKPDASEGRVRVYKTGSKLTNTKTCDELVIEKAFFSGGILSDPETIDTMYTYKSTSGDTIFYFQNNAFQILYDFSAAVGDSFLVHVNDTPSGEPSCLDSSYAQVANKDMVNLDGSLYRRLTLMTPSREYVFKGFENGTEVNERFGVFFNFLFPVELWGGPYWCSTVTESVTLTYILYCFSDDSLVYDVDCDYFETWQWGFDENEKTKTLEISPNPFNDHLNIPIHTGEEIIIYNSIGKIVDYFTENPNNYDFSHYPKGIYHLSIRGINNFHYKLLKY